MPVQKITRKLIESLTPPTTAEKEFYWDTELKGFGVVITARGKKTFIINYTNRDNRYRRKTLGDCNKISVEQARTIAKDLFHDIAKGSDPIAEEAAYREEPTFAQAIADYYAQHMSTHCAASTLKTERRRIERVLLPAFGPRVVPSG